MTRLQHAHGSKVCKPLALLLAFFASTLLLSAQVQTRSGKVTDENGQPIPNVSVTVRNAQGGTTTNDQGAFTINAAAGSVLIFSNVNFEVKEVPVGSGSTIDVSLRAKSGAMNEVVVVGYGAQKKVNLTGAIATVDNKKIENRPVTNAIAALQGLAAGVTVTRTTGEPGREGYDLQIRGASSVNGSAALVLIDGVPGSLGGLNPNDIENISVLKDAAAASIYGARAAGGVVLVTTKRGKSGKLVVSYNGKYASQKPANVPGKLHSWEEAEMLNISRINAGQSAGYTDEQIGWMKDPNVNYVVNPSNVNDYLYFYDLDQRPLVLRDNSPLWDHNVSLRGGGQKDNFFLSLGYFDQQGVFKLGPDNTNRVNARFNYSTKFSEMFSLDARLAYRQSNILSPSVGNARIFSNLYTTRSLYPTFFPGTTDRYINDNSGNFAYALLKEAGANDTRVDDASAQFVLKAKDVVKGLTLSAAYSPRMVVEAQEINVRTIPRYNLVGIGSYMNNPNSFTKNNFKQFSNNVQLLADFTRNWGDHDFHVLGGYAYEDQRNDNTTAIARNLASNDFFTLNIGDPVQASNTEDIQQWGLESYFARVNYVFKNRYLFEVNLRYDGSSKLAATNRWHAFPSLSVGWRLNQEDWFSNALPFFDEFKLRGSWGRLGNSDGVIGNYDHIALLAAGSAYPFNNVRSRSYYQAVLASPNKTWETIETSNVGLDMALLKNRLTVTADYFVKRNDDMLAPKQLSSIIGVATSTYNLASLKTWGWELSAGWRDNIGKFAYWINANIGDNQNKILNYNGQTAISPGINQIIQGYSINTIFGYDAMGYFQTADEVSKYPTFSTAVGAGDLKYRDVNGDGKINAGLGRASDHGDLVNLGNTNPRYTYGFDFGFSFKGIDFSAMFQGVGERKLFVDPTTLYPYTSSWIMPMDYNKDYWTPQNPNAQFPRLFIGGAQNTVRSSHWLMNGAYLRLKNVQLGYNLPTEWIAKAKLSAAKIYVGGQDLWEINKMWIKSAFDPETPNNATWQYPFFRTVMVGVNLTF
ncbi:SusC/RagA family TonB-linked outer membrane protein [Paraflavitalea pollutisoli]|uniref:SusC/RagA family TonB-linked outer membrane protein n=1 Tax=Paraflavitalea pollutisoli TaxID=3034143 RepID=UPI0023ED1F87|nr:TonB-dependent receptor [Paraflavitalea sp. H1-2-19X]